MPTSPTSGRSARPCATSCSPPTHGCAARSNPWAPQDDWKPTVGDSIRVVLEEEWAHLRYIRRDLVLLAESEKR